MPLFKGTVLSEKFGAKIELLSPVKNGCAVVRVLEVGEMLEGVNKNQVVKDFAVTFGVLRFTPVK
ncbi:hypothetical protein HOT95_gp062 [Vibrio phage vB_VpS_PG07]|uniref:Uncharacterized protein n=3 Tax=Pogseptimavirus TaxID=2732037 RepID=A0A411BKH4_9CAUD|nr:hypothetical protein HOT95_gp062 [Vibrio phage vB_VpS_PG07]YP_009819581.1 hypothetical protein HOV08_gp064 [Vibrio phage VspSw_1]AXQ66687.1 hypothetical protein [Vibrio phage vB_VpS_PG07]QAY02137.1 hypothetical protein VspSw1_64 [Vibrio phage VspSw_1]QKN88460.1 hypothetical protein vBValSX1_67 [Vibrio phage vB_ValS_X1]